MSEARAAQFQKLVDQQPENDLFRFSLAQALEATDRPDDAVQHYERCIAAKADWMMPRILLGKLQLRLGNREAARALLEEALRLALDQDHEEPAMELQALISQLAGTDD